MFLDSPTRKRIDLAGLWTYTIEGGNAGSVRIPSAYDFVGAVTFRRQFEIEASDLGKYQFQLVMFGTNYNCNVRVNDDFVGNHVGGYTSFTIPVPTNVLQVGKENIIQVSIENRLDATKTVPLRSQVWGWRNYGGILRDVFLLATPKTYVSDVVISTSVNEALSLAKVFVTAAIGEEASATPDSIRTSMQAQIEVFEKLSGTLVATSSPVSIARRAKEWDTVRTELSINSPRLWSPESPDLYVLKVHLIDAATGQRFDEFDEIFGVRRVDISQGRILLNGKRVLLKGMIWMEDHPAYGSALTYQQMEKDVALMKAVGTNAIRFSHHPPHPYMLSLCDQYGLFALEEIPVKDVPASILTHENYLELASITLREMVTRDRNHPSVLAWGLGDEFETWTADARSYVEPLAKLARTLDDRPLYYGTRLRTGDMCADLVDLTALSLSTRDIKEFRKQLEQLRSAHADRPLIIAKMGSEVQTNNRNGYSDPLSYEAQARFILQHFDIVRSTDCDGAFIWSFNDWKGDRPALTVNSGDPWMHTLGIVTYDREKRLAYGAVRSAFNADKFVALPIGSRPSSTPIVYVLTGLVILIGLAYLYNASRRFREGLNRSLVNSYNFFADVRDQRIVTIFHSTILGLAVSAGAAIVTSSFLFHFRHSIALDNLLSYILVTDRLKEIVVELALNPKLFIPVFTGVLFLKLLALSILLWLIAPVFRTRIYPFHAYAVTMWSTPPLLILVPLGMIFFRILDSPVYVLPSIVLILVLLLWVFIRWLKGVAIILDSYPLKVYALGFVCVIGLFVGIFLYLDYTQSASVYVNFLYRDLVSQVQ
ncbi:MAG: hypothetical protein HY961_18100 [Ignavibacteriae bacterium]|nr:hypothetical protein [Ignavibacteriota bacterium]